MNHTEPITQNQGLNFGLEEVEWDRIVDRLGRAPNEFEALIFCVLWSEEISNKTSSAMLATIERSGLDYRGSNVGFIDIDEKSAFALRTITENPKTQVESTLTTKLALSRAIVELAATGATIDGVHTSFCVGTLESNENSRSFRQLIIGLADFINSSGLPLLGNDLYFHPGYDKSLLTTISVFGTIAKYTLLNNSRLEPSSPILYLGSKVGYDGLRPSRNSAPIPSQGDPLFSFRLANALIEIKASIHDSQAVSLGAGGLAVGATSLASRCNLAFDIDLNKVPCSIKDPIPHHLLFSPTSERALLAISPDDHRKASNILQKWEIPSLTIGELRNTPGFTFSWNHNFIADIPLRFLGTSGIEKKLKVIKFPPMLKREIASPTRTTKRQDSDGKGKGDDWSLIRKASEIKDNLTKNFGNSSSVEDSWVDLLACSNVCDRSAIETRIEQTGLRATLNKIVISTTTLPLYTSKDPYLGTMATVAQGIINLAALGATPLAFSHALNFGNPENYREICDLSEAIRALKDSSNYWGIPIISDEVSLGNGTEVHPILPTPVITMAGILPHVNSVKEKPTPQAGDILLLVGETKDELACSEYRFFNSGEISSPIPEYNFDTTIAFANLLREAAQAKLAQTIIPLRAGGLAITLADISLNNKKPIGISISFNKGSVEYALSNEVLLYSESPCRALLTCSQAEETNVRALCKQHGFPISASGTFGGKKLSVAASETSSVPLATAYRIWSQGLNRALGIH